MVGRRRPGRGLRVARAGWLVALSLVAAAATVLVLDGAAPAGPPSSLQLPPAPASPTVLVVLDGVTADDATSPARMPALAALAARGASWRARVDAVVPSTVAGIQALVEGRAAMPASFLADFGAPPAERGGLLQAARGAGRRVFVAGPHLWTDLYGEHVDASATVTTVGADDERLVAAALAAIASRRFDLVVLHLAATDDAAHVHGVRSAAYADALRRADDDVGRVRRAVPDGARLIVTADHGVTDAGGHAGVEPAVVTVPVIVTPALPGATARRQVDVPALARASLGLAPPDDAPARPVAELTATRGHLATTLGLTAGAFGGGLLALVVAPSRARGRHVAPLIALFFVTTALVTAGIAPLALLLLGAVAPALLLRAPRRGGRPPRAGPLALGGVAGAGLGVLRLVDGADGGRASPTTIVAAVALAALVAAWLGRRRAATLVGVVVVVVVVGLTRSLGEGASLSTIDVRAAFALVDGPLGVPGAVAAVMLRHGLVAGACALGVAWALVSSDAPPRRLDGLLRGLTAALLAQALVFTLAYGAGALAAHASAWDAAQRLRGLGLGGLVRLALEGTALYLTLGTALAIAAARPKLDGRRNRRRVQVAESFTSRRRGGT